MRRGWRGSCAATLGPRAHAAGHRRERWGTPLDATIRARGRDGRQAGIGRSAALVGRGPSGRDAAGMSSSSLGRRVGFAAVVVILVAAIVAAIQLLDDSDAAAPAPAPRGFEAVVNRALPSVVQITSE